MRRGAALRLVFLVFIGWGSGTPFFRAPAFYAFALLLPRERMISHVFPWALPFTDLIGTDSFTETLRQENIATWLSATNHRFVAELFDGSIAPQVMAGYLVQD